eukprot:COSAG06_NODE_32880_length_498_cov_12.897243_1_plen_56_part_10
MVTDDPQLEGCGTVRSSTPSVSATAVLAAPRMAATALSRPRGALRAQPLCSGLTRP